MNAWESSSYYLVMTLQCVQNLRGFITPMQVCQG